MMASAAAGVEFSYRSRLPRNNIVLCQYQVRAQEFVTRNDYGKGLVLEVCFAEKIDFPNPHVSLHVTWMK